MPKTSISPRDVIERAEKLMRRGEPEKALAALNEATVTAPRTAEVWQMKANVLFYLNRAKEAFDALDAGLDKVGADSNLLRTKAQYHHFQGEFDDAIKAFDRLIVLEPQSMEGWLGKGWSLLSEGKGDLALDCADRAIALDASSADAHALRGDCLLSLKRWSEAFAAYSIAADRDPPQFDSSNWVARGDDFLRDEQLDYALRSYEAAIKQDENSPEGYLGKGHVLKGRGEADGAVAAFVRASEIGDQFITGYLEAGELYRERHDDDKALAFYERAKAAQPDDPVPLRYIGDLHAERGRHEEARTAYEEATRLDPEHAETWNALGYSFYNLGRLDEAIRSYERAIHFDPSFGWPHYHLTWVHVRQRRWEEALKTINAAVDLDKTNAHFWVGRLWVLSETNNIPESEVDAIFDQVFSVVRSDPALEVLVASMLANNNRVARAREFMHGMAAPTTEDDELRLNRAECLLKIGDTADALQLIRSVDPGNLRDFLPMTRSFLELFLDRLAGAPRLSDELMASFIREYMRQADHIDEALEWSFKGVRSLLARSELSLPEKFVLATLMDLQHAKVSHEDLAFFTEIWSVPKTQAPTRSAQGS